MPAEMEAHHAPRPATCNDNPKNSTTDLDAWPLSISTPATTTSPDSTLSFHLGPAPSAVLTPASLVDDFPIDAVGADTADIKSGSNQVPVPAAVANVSLSGVGHHRPVPIMSQTAPGPASESVPAEAQSSAPTTGAPSAFAAEAPAHANAATLRQKENIRSHEYREKLVSAASPQSTSLIGRGRLDPDRPQQHGPGANRDNPVPHSASPPANLSTPLTEAFPPMHTSSVLPGTKIRHPKPITLPSSGSSTPLPISRHHLPEQAILGSAFSGNVAHLEATAERLSTGTSSIDDAIRDLHGELKRTDSRRSSILAASLKLQNDDGPTDAPPAVGQLKRHLSNASSIVATNIAARHGGYSPGGFVMSPNHSFTGRLRSGSKNSSGRPEFDTEPVLTRHGPGKASVRSVRSTKLSLAEISESEPTSLTKDVLDAADAAPPIEDDFDNAYDVTIRPIEQRRPVVSGTDAFHQMLDDSFETGGRHLEQTSRLEPPYEEPARPSSSHSVNTFQQAQDAFVDFDGVHWESEPEQVHLHFEQPMRVTHEPEFPMPHLPSSEMIRPQSYLDPQTGQQMLYYPARVPAMLNLPPKLSSKPKAEQRQNRRSQVLSAMLDANQHSEEQEAKRRSGMPEAPSQTFLPDPLAGHRGSFIALSQEQWHGAEDQAATTQPDPEPANANDSASLRRPQRLSRNELSWNEPDNRKDRASRLSNLPPQLRASAFFELPSAAPKVEVKQGSAMATLDSILDASTSAPVGAFTNHAFGGKLGDEIYGKEKKHKPKPSASSQGPESAEKSPKKKRSSRSWFKRRSHNSEEKSEARDSHNRSCNSSVLGDAHAEPGFVETQGPRDGVDGGSVRRDGANESDEEESDGNGGYVGQPTTLLAELQLRKQEQKQRTQPRAHGQASHMTLLEMDAVAETQRKRRQKQRVNLAWEDPNAHLDQNGSDDEDVPLAIIAAKHQGAKNMADLQRPIGLLERRDIEDNEPLSHRKSRLQGLEPESMALQKRQSVATLSAHLGGNVGHVRNASSLSRLRAISPEDQEPEIEEETLGDRKRRLEAKELPRARPVSSSFSAELLGHFGDAEDAKDKPSDEKNKENLAPSPADDEEEETLGQRRRRLQAEREAREREMSYNNLVGQPGPAVDRRLSMADMLSAHPKRDMESRAQKERLRTEQEQLVARDREAAMAAFRKQMPTTLKEPNVDRSGGFRSGIYNDGHGGFGAQAAQSTSAINTHGLGHIPRHNRSTTAMSAYGMQMPPVAYIPINNFDAHTSNMGNTGGYGATNQKPYGRGSVQLSLQAGVPPPMNTSMKRVDQWRHGVMP